MFEQAAAFGEVGAGIQISPNAARVLHHLGLEAGLQAVASRPAVAEVRHWRRGRLISATPLGDAARVRYGFPYYHLHRADLLAVLLDAVAGEPLIDLHPAAPVDAIRTGALAVGVRAGGRWHHGALLVGADGAHSTVRTALFGAERPAYAGSVAWRALVPVERLPAALARPAATLWWGPGRHFVHYPVRRNELVNCVGVVARGRAEQPESWSRRGDREALRRCFAGWHETILHLIDNVDPSACFEWALFDRQPMRRWSAERATLLGDACHPMLPFLAQGAAMAVEDAAVLARCVAGGGDPAASLRRYERLRRRRTARVQAASRRNAGVFHLDGLGAWLRDLAAPRIAERQLDWLFRYDAFGVGR